jgi:hypothetical protein
VSDNKNYDQGRTSKLLSHISSAEEKIFSNVVIRSGCFLSICSARRMYLPGAAQMFFYVFEGRLFFGNNLRFLLQTRKQWERNSLSTLSSSQRNLLSLTQYNGL